MAGLGACFYVCPRGAVLSHKHFVVRPHKQAGFLLGKPGRPSSASCQLPAASDSPQGLFLVAFAVVYSSGSNRRERLAW